VGGVADRASILRFVTVHIRQRNPIANASDRAAAGCKCGDAVVWIPIWWDYARKRENAFDPSMSGETVFLDLDLDVHWKATIVMEHVIQAFNQASDVAHTMNTTLAYLYQMEYEAVPCIISTLRGRPFR
jgi:hypothetical protein